MKCEYCGYESDTEVHLYQSGTGLIIVCDNLSECQKRMVDKVKKETREKIKNGTN